MLAKKTEYLHNSDFFAGVAQLVEHLTCNQGVASSIPAAGTNSKKTASFKAVFFLPIFSLYSYKKPPVDIKAVFLDLVPTARLELARARLTTPSRWRVYQFHHVG